MTARLPTAVPASSPAAARSDLGPALVEGRVMHRRTRPAANAFTYPAFCLRLPLSRLEALPALGIARNRPGLLSFHDRDHGARDGTPLEPWIRGLLAREGIRADGEVVLHAFPRMLGYVFNPVSFWVCHDAHGDVAAVLAEVNNTFGERHLYLVAHPDGRRIADGDTLGARKVFHVSPFCEVRGHYAFRFHFGPGRWLARIDYYDDDDAASPLLATSISGIARPLTRAAARALLVRHPAFTLGVVARIHWQAAKLWIKRVPFFTKPSPPASLISR
jgi:DUF1365 family protein